MPSRRLTIYLMSEAVASIEEAINADKAATHVELNGSAGLEGRFLYATTPALVPSWVNFLQPVLAEEVTNVRSASASGLLLLKTSGRVFALTFGYGRSLLDLSKIEHQFGLRVALNRIDPRQIRSLDKKTFEDIVVTTNTQASRSAELPVFGVDISTDILRAVTGEPRDQGLAKRLSGADALVLSLETTASDLPGICDDLLSAFGEDAYKADFAWIDQLALVRRGDVIDALDGQLVAQLRAGDTSTTHLAMPESIGWEDVDEFRIGGTRTQVYDDLDLDLYLLRLGGKVAELTIDQLKSRRVSVRFTRSQSFDVRWTLYQCVVTEQRLHDELYALIEGRWFRVSRSLVEEVDAFLSTIEEPRVTLGPATSGEQEGDYNARMAAAAPQELICFDARIKRPGGAASGIELCDLLSSDGEFVHVKRKARSSTLSHLFAQGSVSATTFLSDGPFRAALRAHIVDNVEPASRDRWLALIPPDGDPIDRASYRVTYAVLANSDRQGLDWLPFFSKLNLVQNARQIANLGLPVSITRVPVE